MKCLCRCRNNDAKWFQTFASRCKSRISASCCSLTTAWRSVFCCSWISLMWSSLISAVWWLIISCARSTHYVLHCVQWRCQAEHRCMSPRRGWKLFSGEIINDHFIAYLSLNKSSRRLLRLFRQPPTDTGSLCLAVDSTHTAVGLFRFLVRRSRIHCQMNWKIRLVMFTASNSSLKQACLAFTSVTSASEVNFNGMRSINSRFTLLYFTLLYFTLLYYCKSIRNY